MNQEFKQCLEGKKIIPFARGKKLVEKELSIAQSDLSDAKQVLRISDTNGQLYRPTMPCSMLLEHLSKILIHNL